jgi:hypothetical protein
MLDKAIYGREPVRAIETMSVEEREARFRIIQERAHVGVAARSALPEARSAGSSSSRWRRCEGVDVGAAPAGARRAEQGRADRSGEPEREIDVLEPHGGVFHRSPPAGCSSWGPHPWCRGHPTERRDAPDAAGFWDNSRA